ncbi:1-(5-phosphoribosyl)-5-[(5-phosphoribosylamino) methylideneamino] imidazole-4-carboxamide isomerase [Fulvitalea axinellae]|uniref:1-(5-phosphoribosyl)-5-[(5-phosphoribosylamino)methylideneamino] imidazole-4-carboxamide isomerase n=1 Tax=Fulvitalea axinellae TaxID=1182444 RepID=A0AAU9CI65_9BACT|nr:1-(5-phosphoribosyl)-5-[(5-phosphoribosylamino) methylideneamino] imidazole-4-carboxamide isomerase [Fulvitalea axinellae]
MIEIIPSISVLDGKVVRLTQGDYEKAKVYNHSIIDLGKIFEDHGIHKIHLVDLDGAREGEPKNENSILTLKAYSSLEINSAGGILTDGAAAKAFECGASSITVGQAAIVQPKLFEGWLMSYGRERVCLAADSANGKIYTRGWQKETDIDMIEHIRHFYDRGLKYVKSTDICKDGLLEGPNFEMYKKILKEFPDIYIYSSGGVRSTDDIKKLSDIGVKGVIIGKALYEDKITLKEMEQFCVTDNP